MDQTTKFREIILVGGGHAHALVIRQWAMNPLPGVRLTLISPAPHTPYSGMLPGLLAGHYNFDDIHIDLLKLCKWAGVRFIQDRVTGVYPTQKRLSLNQYPNLTFDLLSLDIGSTPDLSVPGAAEYAAPVKPLSGFLKHWKELENHISLQQTTQLVVVGGGSGSVEIALAAAFRFETQVKTRKLNIQLVCGGRYLKDHPKSVRSAVAEAFEHFQVQVLENRVVKEIEESRLITSQGVIDFDKLLWCTHAAAAKWLKNSELALTEDGFIRVNEHLQSVANPDIFCAGDIAHMDHTPRPKAGVYAVRQGPFLFHNLIAHIQGQPLKNFLPQKGFLSLLALGDQYATGSKGVFSIKGSWVWRWKDHIDQKFMAKLKDLPELSMQDKAQDIPKSLIPEAERYREVDPNKRCAACGAKVAPAILNQVLKKFQFGANFVPEDAALIPAPQDHFLQTVDQISAPFDDPYLFSRIAAVHALSDIYARNGIPKTAQAVITLPIASNSIQTRELSLTLEGLLAELQNHGVKLVGGHSSEGKERGIALTINGESQSQSFNKSGAKPKQKIILTKPLGTGMLLAAHMKNRLSGHHWQKMIPSLTISNQYAAEQFSKAGASTVTDVTGFGLLGHLSELLTSFQGHVQLNLDNIPFYNGAKEACDNGIQSTLSQENLKAVNRKFFDISVFCWPYLPLLVDPQTSGGLLGLIDKDYYENEECDWGWVIGETTD